MGLLDVRKAEHLRRFCPIDIGSDPIDDVLERNLRKRKVRRSPDERTGKNTEMRAARHLEDGLQSQRAAPAQKPYEANMPATPQHGEGIEDCGHAPLELYPRADAVLRGGGSLNTRVSRGEPSQAYRPASRPLDRTNLSTKSGVTSVGRAALSAAHKVQIEHRILAFLSLSPLFGEVVGICNFHK